jgi:hypothetical protein
MCSTAMAWVAHLWRAQKNAVSHISPLFWTLSFISLWFPMGFRFEIGPDYFSYQRMYELIADVGVLDYYRLGGWIELGYLLLLKFVSIAIGDFNGLFPLTAFIGLFLFFKAITNEYNSAHPAMCLFVFSTTIYFYFWGIDRLFLAVAISYHCLEYLFQGKIRQYFAGILIASLFHVSALVMIGVAFINRHDKERNARGSHIPTIHQPLLSIRLRRQDIRFIGLLLSLPFIFQAIALIIPYLPDRYHQYGTVDDRMRVFLSIGLKLPIAIILYYAERTVCRADNKYKVFATMYYASLFFQAFGGLVGVGRIGWYFWPSLCFALPMAIKASGRSFLMRVALVSLTLIYCIGYLIYAYFNPDGDRWELMFPYKNMFFEL